jgi:hypothetical protein
MKREASCRSSLNSNPFRLSVNLRPCGVTKITPPLKGIVTSLSPLLMPATFRVFRSRTTLYLSSNATSPKRHLICNFAVPRIKHISHHAQEQFKELQIARKLRSKLESSWRRGWDLNPRGPRGQQLSWPSSLRSRGSTLFSSHRSKSSVALPS